jgi:subtilase family serine protease
MLEVSLARRLGLALFVCCLATWAAAGHARAAGRISNGHAVSLPCANPANHGRRAAMLGPAHVAVGGTLRCFGDAIALAGKAGPDVMSGPVGYSPTNIQSAYGITGLTSGGRTVAIVDAYDDPNAASDLNKFRSTYGLAACTTANGCFTKLNQTGKTSPLPTGDPGWGTEISLDLDAVSSACPDCHIVLVEANSASTGNLMTAEDTATKHAGVVAVSNSWGGSEDSSILSDDTHFNRTGVAITASTGDNGYGVSWPASSQYVTAVAGTTLNKSNNNRRWAETAWSGAGSGCSAFETKPSWQHDTGCAKRTVGDVSADANPNTGLGIYDTYNNCGTSNRCDIEIEEGLIPGLDGWAQVGGTSLSSPLIASVYALAGNVTSSPFGAHYVYAHHSSLWDVKSGSNGSCGGSYLCTAGTGYDGPTGWGTPRGITAF